MLTRINNKTITSVYIIQPWHHVHICLIGDFVEKVHIYFKRTTILPIICHISYSSYACYGITCLLNVVQHICTQIIFLHICIYNIYTENNVLCKKTLTVTHIRIEYVVLTCIFYEVPGYDVGVSFIFVFH